MNTESKTIEELEGLEWDEPNFQSYVVTESHKLRRIRIEDLSIEQLRLSLSQKNGIPFIRERVLKELRRNPSVSGDFYDFDLLLAALRLDKKDWQEDQLNDLIELADNSVSEIEDIEIKSDIINQLKKLR